MSELDLARRLAELERRLQRLELLEQATTSGSAYDHGSLIGLSDDDHTQYGALAQNEAVSGSWTFESSISACPNITVDGVDVSTHDHSGAGQGGTVDHGDLDSVAADDHHAGFIGLEDTAAVAVAPAADDYIQLTSTDDSVTISACDDNTLDFTSASSGTNALLDGTVHSDTAACAVTRGSIIVGDDTPQWEELTVGGASAVLKSDGTDPAWAQIWHGGLQNIGADDHHGALIAIRDTSSACAVPGADDTIEFTSDDGSVTVTTSGSQLDLSSASGTGASVHNLLDGTDHNDTVACAATRGSIIVANDTPAWAEVTVGGASTVLRSDGTDAAWGQIWHGGLQDIGEDDHHLALIGLEGTDGASAIPAADNHIQFTSTDDSVSISACDDNTVDFIASSAGDTHTLLDNSKHTDTAACAATRGSIIVSDDTPEWTELAVGGASTILRSDGTDATWGQFWHGGLQNIGEDDHHNAFTGLQDEAATTASPGDVNEVRLYSSDRSASITTSGSLIDIIVASEAGAIIDHGTLDGLSDDDHTQYAELAEDDTVSGSWSFSSTLVSTAGASISGSLHVGSALNVDGAEDSTFAGRVAVGHDNPASMLDVDGGIVACSLFVTGCLTASTVDGLGINTTATCGLLNIYNPTDKYSIYAVGGSDAQGIRVQSDQSGVADDFSLYITSNSAGNPTFVVKEGDTRVVVGGSDPTGTTALFHVNGTAGFSGDLHVTDGNELQIGTTTMISGTRALAASGNVQIGTGGSPVWNLGYQPIVMDFTGTDYDTFSECNALGVRFNEQVPFPADLRWTVSGSLSHTAGCGWGPSFVGDGTGPAILFPLMRPGNWQLDVEIGYDPEESACKSRVGFGYATNSNNVGANVKIVDNSDSACELITSLDTNDGDDMFSNHNVGANGMEASGFYTYKFRCWSGTVGHYDEYSDTWYNVPTRATASGGYTAGYAFIQFASLAGASFGAMYVSGACLTYLL